MEQKKTTNRTQIYILIIVILIAAILGVAYMVTSNAGSTQVVANGDTIQVYYTGTLANGTQFDSNVGKEPLNFTVGANEVIPGFDQGVIGMKINESKTITIPPSEAYGEANPELIVKVPLSVFGNETVSVGMIVRSQSSSGQQVQGTVTSVNSTNATVDFNSPLAGQTLIFDIKVVGIEKK